MLHEIITINVYNDLAKQLFYIERQVAEAKKANQRIRLVDSLKADKDRRISEAAIKALMHSLNITNYVEIPAGKNSGTVKFTLAEITKSETDVFTRNWDKFALAVGLPTVVAGGVGAGLLG